MTRFRLAFLPLVLFPVLAFALTALLPVDRAELTSTIPSSTVRTAVVRTADEPRTVRMFGVTRGKRQAMASFTLGGRLEERPLEIGDAVRRDQVIARLDRRPYQNKLSALEGTLAEVEANLAQLARDEQRSRSLLAEKAATIEEVEKVSAARAALTSKREGLRAEVRELERLLEEATLLAPVSGTVTEVFKEPGEFTGPGEPVYAISGQRAVEVEIEVPEAMILEFTPGEQVSIDFPHLKRMRVPGRIDSIGTSSLGPGRLFPVLVDVEAFPGLIPGLTAEIVLTKRARTGTSVPIEAVIDPGGEDAHVFRVEDDRAVSVPVRVTRFLGESVLVEGDLYPGETVIVAGHLALMDGDPISGGSL